MRSLRLKSALKEPVSYEEIQRQLPETERKGIIFSDDIKNNYPPQYLYLLEQSLEKMKETNAEMIAAFKNIDFPLIVNFKDLRTEEQRKEDDKREREFKTNTSGGFTMKFTSESIFWDYGENTVVFKRTEDSLYPINNVKIIKEDIVKLPGGKRDVQVVEGLLIRGMSLKEIYDIDSKEISDEEKDTEYKKERTITSDEADKLNLLVIRDATIFLDIQNIIRKKGLSLESVGTSFAHELGHVYHAIKKPCEAFLWIGISKLKGHEVNNPSGIEAENQKKLFEGR